MDIAHARLVVGAIVGARLHSMGIGNPPNLDLLRRTSLADMVQANALVVAANAGSPNMQVVADDRLTAAVYTMLHFDAEDQDDCEPIITMEDGRPSFLVHIYSKGEGVDRG